MSGEKQCRPASLCSGDYIITGLSSGVAAVKYKTFTGQGHLELGGKTYRIVKHGLLKPHWSLEAGDSGPAGKAGANLAEAHQAAMLSRHDEYEISAMGQNLLLKPSSFLTRDYRILSEGRVIGTISRVHFFTRRSRMQCSDEVSDLIQVFCFWMVGLAWRESRDTNAASE